MSDQIPVQVGVSAAQLELVDRFQREKDLPTREAALQLLLDVAFEAVTGRGRRFWDKPLAEPEPGLD
jgi:hypothetical protein